MRGKIVWFNDAKGYGYIAPEKGGRTLTFKDQEVWNFYKKRKKSKWMELLKPEKWGHIVSFDVDESIAGSEVSNVKLLTQ